MPQPHTTLFHPPTDILERANQWVVMVELAGIVPDDIEVALFQTRLVVSGQRQKPDDDVPTYHQAQINYGAFKVEVKLPWQVDDTAVRARYKDGFLRIELPRNTRKHIPISGMNPHKQDE